MAYSTFSSNPFGFTLTPWVKRILIANVAAFVLLLVARLALGLPLEAYLAFRPADALWRPWTAVTYMFVHAGFWHLLFNSLGLFFFGPVLEERWGSREFVKFYLLAGLGGAALSCISPHAAIVGASAAVYGVMVAFAMYWPDTPIYIWGIFPVKAKWLVTFLVGMSLVLSWPQAGGGSGTAHLAHLGGAVAAFAYLKSPLAPSPFGGVPASRRKKKRDWRELLGRRRKPTAVTAVHASARPAPAARSLDDVDRILDKISESGIESLTADERRRLEEASRRLGSN